MTDVGRIEFGSAPPGEPKRDLPMRLTSLARADEIMHRECREKIAALETELADDKGFKRGIKTAADCCFYMAANRYDPDPKYQDRADIEASAFKEAAEEILELSPEDEAKWKDLNKVMGQMSALETELAAWREVGVGMEWAGISYLAEPTCPYCEGVKPGNSKGYLSLEYTRAREGHKSDCKLAALLGGK